MNQAIFEYKCRRCEGVVDGSLMEERSAKEIMSKVGTGGWVSIPYQIVHVCGNGEGIADISGFRIIE